MKKFTFAVISIIVSCACSSKDIEIIPHEFQDFKYLSVILANTKLERTISFQKQAVYGDSKEGMIGGLGDVAVDWVGRVFIADTRKQVIYAFNTKGELIDELGGSGRGPGEFSFIKSLEIRENRLYVFDFHQNRVIIFSLEALQYEETIVLGNNKGQFQDLINTYPLASELFVMNRNNFIVKFLSNNTPTNSRWINWNKIEIKGHLYLVDHTGNISGKVMNFTNSVRTIIPYNGVPALEFPLIPFYGRAHTVISSENLIYHAEPDYFLVKVFKQDGAYQRAFYYPLKKIPLTRASAIEKGIPELGTSNPDLFINGIDSMELPESWPVIKELKIDERDRLWVATTVKDLDIYEWWVLDDIGNLITRFEWPRDEPIEVVKNGYMYTRETDEQTGLQQIVRYKFEFEGV